MVLTRSTSLVTVSLFCLVAMPASGAIGATKKKSTTPPRPTVSSVAPLTAGVGDQLTIKGNNFIPGKQRNTVLFKAGSTPAISVKATQASKTMLKVVIPKSVEKYMTVKDGAARPTRFRLRVLAKRFAKSYVAIARSPLIGPANAPHEPDAPAPGAKTPGATAPGAVGPADPVAAVAVPDCDGDGIADSVDGDDDNDLLSDTLEVGASLNACSADTDADGIEDGYEYQSALDLNNTGVNPPLPYPGKRPYPNPLDGGDANTDYDGDGLAAAQEYLMWKTFGARTLVLSYSAGLKKSTAGALSCPTRPGPNCNDDFRDVESDGLSNWDEFNGRMTPGWWAAVYAEVPYTEPYAGTSAIEADSDGDLKLDGADDTDHDLWTNAEEISRNLPVGAPRGDGSSRYRVQPFNPCLPDYTSPTCSEHPPLSNPYPPFDAPLPPAPIVVP